MKWSNPMTRKTVNVIKPRKNVVKKAAQKVKKVMKAMRAAPKKVIKKAGLKAVPKKSKRTAKK